MPKRTFWLVTGGVIGAGSSLWAERKVRRTLQEATAKLQPDALVVEVGRSARHAATNAGGRMRNAVSSGRDEMFRREEELWAELAAQGAAPTLPRTGSSDGPGYAPAPTGRTQGKSMSVRPRRPAAKSASHLGN